MRPTLALRRLPPPRVPALRLFTGANCALCDELRQTLARASQPHTLEAVDIGEKAHREWPRERNKKLHCLWTCGSGLGIR